MLGGSAATPPGPRHLQSYAELRTAGLSLGQLVSGIPQRENSSSEAVTEEKASPMRRGYPTVPSRLYYEVKGSGPVSRLRARARRQSPVVVAAGAAFPDRYSCVDLLPSRLCAVEPARRAGSRTTMPTILRRCSIISARSTSRIVGAVDGRLDRDRVRAEASGARARRWCWRAPPGSIDFTKTGRADPAIARVGSARRARRYRRPAAGIHRVRRAHGARAAGAALLYQRDRRAQCAARQAGAAGPPVRHAVATAAHARSHSRRSSSPATRTSSFRPVGVEAIARSDANARLVRVDDAGHSVYFERAAHFNRIGRRISCAKMTR